MLPGFGVAGVLGALAIGVSIFMSLIGRLPTSVDVLIALNVIVGSMVIVGFAGWQLAKHLPEDRRAKRLLYLEGIGRERGYLPSVSRSELNMWWRRSPLVDRPEGR